MCGIVGLYLKNEEWKPRLGALFSPMLIAMGDRGPDSAGFAVYGKRGPAAGATKLSLRATGEPAWEKVTEQLRASFPDAQFARKINDSYATFTISADEERLRARLADPALGVRVMSIGRSIEIMKEVGPPEQIVSRFSVEKLEGSHMIGHTRMGHRRAR